MSVHVNGNAPSLEELAKDCPNSFCCVESGTCFCKVDRVAGKGILILKGEVRFGCPYLLPFGFGHLCICPVHSSFYSSSFRNGSMRQAASCPGRPINSESSSDMCGSNPTQ